VKKMAPGSDRLRIKNIGEYYEGCLVVEAWLKDRTVAVEANSLLCSALMKRSEVRSKMIAELARKRGITSERLWDQILVGEAEQMTPEIYARSNPLDRPEVPEENTALEILRAFIAQSPIADAALQQVADDLGVGVDILKTKLGEINQ
jgi:hypothetical protein